MALVRCGAGSSFPSFELLADMIVDENVDCGNGTTYSVTAKNYDRLMVWSANDSAPKVSTISNIVGDVIASEQIKLRAAVSGTAPSTTLKVRYIFIPAGATLDIASNSTSGNPYDNTWGTFYKFE